MGHAGGANAVAGAALDAPVAGRSAVRPATCETVLDIEGGGEIGLAGPAGASAAEAPYAAGNRSTNSNGHPARTNHRHPKPSTRFVGVQWS